MMKTNLFVACLFAAMITSVAQASDPANEQRLKIEEFGYQGVNFSVSRGQFLKIFPQAQATDDDDAAVGVTCYIVPGRKVDAVSFKFLDDQLMELMYFYRPKSIDRYGGADGLLERAKKKFGPPTRKANGFTVWNFATIDRNIAVGSGDKKDWALGVFRPSVQKDAKDRKEMLEAGF